MSYVELFQFYKNVHPNFLPSTTPSYYHEAFQLLGHVLDGITNQIFSELTQDYIYAPVNMTHSSLMDPPATNLGVIPISGNSSGWAQSLEEGSSYGAMYSLLRDMTNAGRSILNSMLFSPSITRHWLKPGTHTDSPQGTVAKHGRLSAARSTGVSSKPTPSKSTSAIEVHSSCQSQTLMWASTYSVLAHPLSRQATPTTAG